ncbi:MAG TPA: hydrogenase formation protein HypD [Mariprofundaceae bacterium]|nr:hydrogenase formation protein HypD [Mariprofundaceae bacterium]
MKYVDEFRSGVVAQRLAAAIHREAKPGHDYRLMEFCGGHTHAIFRFGVQELVPANVKFVHGPGCPVCVLPAGRIEAAIRLCEAHGVILCTYADLMRVPAGKGKSLWRAKANGADVRMVYSSRDALEIARSNPGRQVVFFAIGFETTTPPTAVAIREASEEGLTNFSVFCNHVLTPPAMRHLLQAEGASGNEPAARLDGILGPSHVSTIIGSRAYADCAEEFRIPIVIAGFEPLDVMQSTLMLIRQINDGRHAVENEYSRAVTSEGNRKAQQLMAEAFKLRPRFEWRGLGVLPESALAIADAYADFDAERRFVMPKVESTETKGCLCPAILRGLNEPTDCKLFGTACTPETPLGACMVSSEGACAAYWSYGRQRKPAEVQRA